MTSQEERDRIRRLVIQSRRRQGLPDHVEDPAFLAQLAAAILADAERRRVS